MEIRSLSKEVFKNHYSKELYDEYREWLPYIIDVYAPIKNSETGDFLNLPFAGGLLDQPYQTMQILKEIQNTYRQVVREENEARIKSAQKVR